MKPVRFETPVNDLPPKGARFSERAKKKEQPLDPKRLAMCESLKHSAKKIATLAAFLGGVESAGCASGTLQIAGVAYAWDKEGSVLTDVTELQRLGRDPNLEDMLTRDREYYGSVPFLTSTEIHRRRRHKFAETKNPRPVEFKGFERLDLAPEKLRDFLATRLPRAWTQPGIVASIAFRPVDEKIKIPGLEIFSYYGRTIHPNDGSPVRIEINSESLLKLDAQSELESYFVEALTHELAHANDWHAPQLDAEQSVRLRHDAVELVSSPRRIKFQEVESIKDDSRQNKPEEYHAELMAQGINFAGPGIEKVKAWEGWRRAFAAHLAASYGLPAGEALKNARHVEYALKSSAPDFKPWEAARNDKAAKETLLKEFRRRRVHQALMEIVDQSVRDFFTHALDIPSDSFSQEARAKSWDRANALNQEVDDSLDQVFGLLATYIVNEREYAWKNIINVLPMSYVKGQARAFSMLWQSLSEDKKIAARKKLLAKYRWLITGQV
ncbi:MAG: hypothetical protein WC641_05655 [Patescibacteria group bacterium]